MNKGKKVFFAIIGACSKVMDMFIPIAVAIMWVTSYGTNNFGSILLLVVAILATLFKGSKIWLD